MGNEQRSGCPINLSLEIFGDRWSLTVIRDMFGNRRHFRELLSQSEEGIASNILSARLKYLLGLGMITKAGDPSHKQKTIYSLTEKAIELVEVFAMLGAWGRRHLPVSRELSIRAPLLISWMHLTRLLLLAFALVLRRGLPAERMLTLCGGR